MDADVIIVGAGPTGLLLAGELALANTRTLVLERRTERSDFLKAGGLTGQSLEIMRCRGFLETLEAASPGPRPAPKFPFAGLHLDFTRLDPPPMEAMLLPQPTMERLFQERAESLGAEVRLGHELTGLSQDDDGVSVRVNGQSLRARYLVGCDGWNSRVRQLAEIPFPGITYPEVNRMGTVARPESITLLDNGDLEVAGLGRIPFGYSHNERGTFAVAAHGPDQIGVFTSEDDSTEYDDEVHLTLDELQRSLDRVVGGHFPLGEASRLTRFTFHARQAERFRDGRILLAGDAAHLFPAPGVPLNTSLNDAFNLGWKLAATVNGRAPAQLLDTYHSERTIACERTMAHTHAQVALRRGHDPAAQALRKLFGELMQDSQPLQRLGSWMAGSDIRYPSHQPNPHPLTGTFKSELGVAAYLHAGRPVFLDLTDRSDWRAIAAHYRHLDVHSRADSNPAVPALLVRPDGYIAWAGEDGAKGLRRALSYWFSDSKIAGV